ncbi:MAG: nucleotidyltransferase family protein, partial [Thaumarchaeota archaeon]|nr:nucleotidyltransferase family protein [Nitrososphaerota archaeon]
MKAVILAGGLGTRLRPYTLFVPKGMLPLGSKPVLEHIIEWLSKNGITDIVLCVGYLSKVISDYFSNGKELGVKISYVKSSRPMGTAGQLKSAQKLLDESFICVYGDVILKNNLRKMISYHKSKKAIATIGLTKYSTKMSYGFIETEKNGLVRSWSEKPEISGLINAGLYVFEPSFL